MMIIRALLSVTETTNQTSKTVPAKKTVPMDAHVPTIYVKVRAIELLIITIDGIPLFSNFLWSKLLHYVAGNSRESEK